MLVQKREPQPQCLSVCLENLLTGIPTRAAARESLQRVSGRDWRTLAAATGTVSQLRTGRHHRS